MRAVGWVDGDHLISWISFILKYFNKKIVVNDNLTDPIAYVRQGNTFDVLPMFIDMTYWYMMYQAINSYTILFVIDVSIWIV